MSTLTAILLALLPAAEQEMTTHIRGGTVYDGTGNPGVVRDLYLRGDRILAEKPEKVDRVIEAEGLIVTAGFIDLHTHSDTPLTREPTSYNRNYLHQGVTTVVTGNCGSGPTDVKAYFEKLEALGQGANVIHLLPHSSIRKRVMGNVNREPSEEQLSKLKGIVAQGMKDGAYGMSTGLIYTPGTYAKTDELVALARVVSEHGGIYASHIRNEALGVVAATQEAIDIGKQAKLPVHISHMKAAGHRAWGMSTDTVALIRKVREDGQKVTADQYPYIASSTSLRATLVPTRFREGSSKDFVERLDDPDTGPRLRQAIADSLSNRRGGIGLQIASCSYRPTWNGKRLTAIAKAEKKTPLEIVLEIERNGGAKIVNFGMSEVDVRLIMKQSFVATASDGGAKTPSKTVPHPRNYGCFPRKISHYVLKEKVIPMEHALRSCNGLPADILGLPERGYLKPGYFADIVIFDPKTIKDTATFEEPHQYAVGVRYLLVNGELAIDQGEWTKKKAGRVLRHSKK